MNRSEPEGPGLSPQGSPPVIIIDRSQKDTRIWRNRQTDSQTVGQPERQTIRQTDRQTDRPVDRQTGRHTASRTDRQIDDV